MAIRTSAITYRRGIPNTGYANFYFVAQSNNTVVCPMGPYLKHYDFYNRNISNPSHYRWPWRP